MDANEMLHAADTEIAELDVGGERYTTTLSTLRSCPESNLARMFSGENRFPRAPDGCFCIDRDGRLFSHILNFLRDGWIPLGLTRADRILLLQEAKFYGLTELHTVLGGAQEPRPPRPVLEETSQPQARLSHTMSPKFEGPTASNSFLSLKPAPKQAAPNPYPTGLGQTGQQDSAELLDDFFHLARNCRDYVRLRYGQEYSGGWVITSPRNLPGVPYELHAACLARSPIEAMNKMSRAGYKPCDYPPQLPRVADFYTHGWEIMMYKDRPSTTSIQRQAEEDAGGRFSRSVSSSSSAAYSPKSLKLPRPPLAL